jgi:hypothetical protein
VSKGLKKKEASVMKSWAKWIVLVLTVSACSLSDPDFYRAFSITYDFSDDDEGWVGDFADYPVDDSIAFGLDFDHTFLPTELDESKKALKLTGTNGSDDLFMFVKKKLMGLRPNTTYAILFNVKVASNAPTNTPGVGGAPGESVFLKVGASTIEPKKVLDEEEMMYRMNIDKGNQNEEGEDMINIGHIGVAANTTKFTVITRNNTSSKPFFITTDNKGEIWVIVGTDSGFEGNTTLYYTSIDILFNEI